MRLLRFALFLVTLCVVQLAFAQRSTYERQFWLGIRGGASMARYLFVPSVPQTMYQGLQAGVVARFDIEQGASLQLEANLSKTGWREEFTDPSLAYHRELSYVEMPILSHLYLGKGHGGVRIFVNIGPFLGYNLKSLSVASGTTFTDLQLLRQRTALKHRFAWGLTGGPGVSIGIGSRHRIELEARAGYNFQDIWGNKRTDPYGQSTELRFSASLTYLLKI